MEVTIEKLRQLDLKLHDFLDDNDRHPDVPQSLRDVIEGFSPYLLHSTKEVMAIAQSRTGVAEYLRQNHTRALTLLCQAEVNFTDSVDYRSAKTTRRWIDIVARQIPKPKAVEVERVFSFTDYRDRRQRSPYFSY